MPDLEWLARVWVPSGIALFSIIGAYLWNSHLARKARKVAADQHNATLKANTQLQIEGFRRQHRVEYLVSTYRTMVAYTFQPIETEEDFIKLRAAIEDVYIFGSVEQQRKMEEIVNLFAGEKPDPTPILNELRLACRRELGESPGILNPLRLTRPGSG